MIAVTVLAWWRMSVASRSRNSTSVTTCGFVGPFSANKCKGVLASRASAGQGGGSHAGHRLAAMDKVTAPKRAASGAPAGLLFNYTAMRLWIFAPGRLAQGHERRRVPRSPILRHRLEITRWISYP